MHKKGQTVGESKYMTETGATVKPWSKSSVLKLTNLIWVLIPD